MIKICEKIVNTLSDVFFGKAKCNKKSNAIKDTYTLSSVFPTTSIMKEIKKYI